MSEAENAAERQAGLDEIVTHMKDCRGAGAAIVVDGSADAVVASMLAEGWTMEPQVDVISGKRIRIMVPPKKDGAS